MVIASVRYTSRDERSICAISVAWSEEIGDFDCYIYVRFCFILSLFTLEIMKFMIFMLVLFYVISFNGYDYETRQVNFIFFLKACKFKK